jgi:hypothetical protein
MAEQPMALSFVQLITLTLSKLYLLQGMASKNDNNDKCKLEEEDVGGHKIHIFTANIPTFHSRYRR